MAIAAVLISSPSVAGQVPPSGLREEIAVFVGEAALRFKLSADLIWAVIAAESGGDPRAISPRGALGLMQLMRRTYAALRVRYNLGDDVFAPHDNILAGAAYLREMYDRFGPGGVLAAYNVGPGRYADHLATGAPLPSETQAYVAKLAPRLVVPLTGEASLDPLTQAMAASLFILPHTPKQSGVTAPAALPSRITGSLFVSVGLKALQP